MNMSNFFTQASEANKVVAFRHQIEMETAKKYGAKFNHFAPDSCDMIFPNKEAFEMFERERNSRVWRQK